MKSIILVDVEADGPCPGIYSMIEVGAVLLDRKHGVSSYFLGRLRPITKAHEEDALKAIGRTREETMEYPEARDTMHEFKSWLSSLPGKPMFFSDNNGFDWQFVNYYFHLFLGENPFGHSSTNIGSLYKGMNKNMFVNFKHLRKTSHTHNAVDDSTGNAEALEYMINEMGLKI